LTLPLALAGAFPLLADTETAALPRRLSISEALPEREIAPDIAWALLAVADRIGGLQNPYRVHEELPPASLRSEPAPLPLAAEGERRWFQMEDSGDWMGTRLLGQVTAGLSVDFTGPAEEPPATRKIISIKGDPYHPRYVLTTAGFTLKF
jgi:hypothetical protein